MLNPRIEFVAFDSSLVLTKESWQATRLHCPRCGQGDGAVWFCCSAAPDKLPTGLELRCFVCVSCKHTALGLDGFKPTWSIDDRVKQIMKYGYGVESE